jgi:DNA methyltransferase 1-associated protein 1
MGDVKAILGLNTSVSAADPVNPINPINPHTAPTTTTVLNALTSNASAAGAASRGGSKPPRGVSREVFNLLGGAAGAGADSSLSLASNSASLPMIVPSSSNVMQMSRNGNVVKKGKMDNQTRVSQWVYAPFASSARTDGALFNHWVKAGVEYPDYPFARFNVYMHPVEYSEEEYATYLSTSDPQWTRSDTDQLMGLCRRFDLRWAVIFDRYTATPRRSIEELQERYYSVCSRLTNVRLTVNGAGPIAVSNPIITIGTGSSAGSVNSTFNYSTEKVRRRQNEIMWRRSKEDEKEDEDLKKELKIVEVALRKIKKNGKTGLVNASAGATYAGGAADGGNYNQDAESNSAMFKSQLPQPGAPYLQSARLENPVGMQNGLSKSLIKKMEMVLRELGVEERPLPTKTVCDYYDHLRKSVVTLLTLHKIAAKKETLLSQRKTEIRNLGGNIPESDSEIAVKAQQKRAQAMQMQQQQMTRMMGDGGGGGGGGGAGGGMGVGGNANKKQKR